MRRFLRAASLWICVLIHGLMPEQKKAWAYAVRAEVENIDEDAAAFLFALDAFRGLVLFSLSRRFYFSVRASDLPITHSVLGNTLEERVGRICAFAAVLIGLLYLFAAGAPVQMLLVNSSALVLGFAAVAIIRLLPNLLRFDGGIASFLMACFLLFTALNGTEAQGASRWMSIGPITVQPSLILLPIVILTFARERDGVTTIAALISALAMALQPDRAMAGVLMVSILTITIMRIDRFALFALAGSVAGFGMAMISPELLPAVPYVDHVFFAAFDLHVLLGIAVALGIVLLLVPAVYAINSGSTDRRLCATFLAIWLSVVVAAAIGNYPTPLLGYGASAILGYVLSLAVLLNPANSLLLADASLGSDEISSRKRHLSTFASYQLA